jgi:hypothetical protein
MVIKKDDDTVKISLTPTGQVVIDASTQIILNGAAGILMNGGSGGSGNTLEVKSSGGISATNATAELLETIDALFTLIQTNTVPAWAPSPQASYAAEMSKLASFLV